MQLATTLIPIRSYCTDLYMEISTRTKGVLGSDAFIVRAKNICL